MSITPAGQTASTPTPVPHASTVQGVHAAAAEQSKKEGAEDTKSTSPPAQIVSDIPGAAPSTTSSAAPPATMQAKVSASSSVNGLAFRTADSPAAAVNSTQQPGIVKWRANIKPINTPQKVPIMDAPGTGAPAPLPTATSGFPSPGRERIHQLPKFVDDRTRITFGIQQSLPEAVRRSVRDNWEKCLIGSDFHQAFVLNATIHHAAPAAIRRGIDSFGKTMVAAARNEIIDHMSAADLDKVANRILAKASTSFLDKALEMRLKTIGAKHLINALARAERLGYEPSDVQDDAGSPAAAAPLVPSASIPPAKALPHSVVPSQPATPAPTPNLPPHCSLCLRRFFQDSAYEYHIKHKVCQRVPHSAAGFQYSCEHCGQGFTTIAGLNYHTVNKTCSDFRLSSSAQQTSPALPNPPSVATPTAMARRSYSTPRQTPTTQASHAPASTPASQHDPYSHLSQEQIRGLQADLDAAEVYYTERIREASTIPDPDARRAKLDGLSNSFSTKQSLIRKKYGVRLRMRRTKEEVQIERNRMSYKTPSELQAEMGIMDPGIKPKPRGRRPKNGRPSSVGKVSGFNTPGQMSTPEPTTTTLASSLAVPQNNPGIKDSNDVSMGNSKRSYTGDGESPSAKRIAYAEMGGLGGDVTMEAETTDPTAQPAAVAAAAAILKKQDEQGGAGTAEEPMMLDDSGTASGEEDDDDDSSGDDDDEDIPAQLPANVLQSLQRSSSAAAASPRTGSI